MFYLVSWTTRHEPEIVGLVSSGSRWLRLKGRKKWANCITVKDLPNICKVLKNPKDVQVSIMKFEMWNSTVFLNCVGHLLFSSNGFPRLVIYMWNRGRQSVHMGSLRLFIGVSTCVLYTLRTLVFNLPFHKQTSAYKKDIFFFLWATWSNLNIQSLEES